MHRRAVDLQLGRNFQSAASYARYQLYGLSGLYTGMLRRQNYPGMRVSAIMILHQRIPMSICLSKFFSGSLREARTTLSNHYTSIRLGGKRLVRRASLLTLRTSCL